MTTNIKTTVRGTIDGRPMTKAELALEVNAMHRGIQTQMKAMSKSLNLKVQGGHIGLIQGGLMPGANRARETKQPQDKVLRLVMARGDDKYLITQCVIAFLGSMVTGVILGAYITSADDVVWWAVLPMIMVSCAPMALVAYFIKQKFKQAEAKADLLNWPE